MKNANRIPETFQTDAEYRQWMERWQQEAREATIEGFKQNRKLKGMTQTELGRKAGISQPNITRFESVSYNPSLDFMVKIAAAMGKRVQITLVDELEACAEAHRDHLGNKTGETAVCVRLSPLFLMSAFQRRFNKP